MSIHRKIILTLLVFLASLTGNILAQTPEQSLQLNGTDDYVDLDTTMANNLANSSYTFASWFNTSNVTGSHNTIICVNGKPTDKNRVFLTVNNNGLNFYDVNAGSFRTVSSVSVIDGNWHHVAVTVNATNDELKFYLDGKKVGDTKTSTTRIDTGDVFSLGQDYDGSNKSGTSDFMDGQIDEVQIWNKALSMNELRKFMYAPINNPAGQTHLIGYYALDGNVNDQANSSSSPDQGGANDGTLKNGAGFASSNAIVYSNPVFTNAVAGLWLGNESHNSGGLIVDTSSLSPVSLNASEYTIWGQNGSTGITNTNEPSGSYTNFKRLQRLWHFKENLGSNKVDLTFDLSETGGGFVTYTNASNVILLKDQDNTGNFTEVATADELKDNSNEAVFKDVNLENGYYYTIAAKNGGQNMLFPAEAPGDALAFDGDDYVEVTNNSALQQQSFTVEAWFKPSNGGGSDNIMSIVTRQKSSGGGTNDRNYWLVIDNGQGFTNEITGSVGFRVGDGNSSKLIDLNSSGTDYRDGKWHHAAAVVDNGNKTAKLYVDGIPVDSSSSFSGNPWAGNAPLHIGNQPGNVRHFDGQIDEVKVWSKARNEDEVSRSMHNIIDPGNHSDLEGYWRFDDNKDPTSDFSPNELSGTLKTNGSTNPQYQSSEAVVDNLEAFSANGQFNSNVKGIWNAKSSATSAGLSVSGSSFNSNENMIFGHNGESGEDTTNQTIDGTTVQSQLKREWFIRDSTSGKTVDFTFTTDKAGTGAFSSGSASDYVLINKSSGKIAKNGASSINSGNNTITFTSVTINSQYTIGTKDETGSPLPVELLYFEANKAGSATQLEWKTASETNNRHFLIQRKTNKHWETLGKIAGNGTTMEPQKYHFKDEDPNVGHNYYRLKQVDYDGSFEYSSIEAVNWAENPIPTSGSIGINGNPVKTKLEVSFQNMEEGTYEYQLVDVQGQIVQKGNWQISAAEATKSIGLTPEQKGIYTLIVVGNNAQYTKKVVKNQ